MPQSRVPSQEPVQGSTGIETEADKEEGTRLPHERDEAADNGVTGTDRDTDPHSKIPQAHEDVERGLVDTDRRGVPSNVPPRGRNVSP